MNSRQRVKAVLDGKKPDRLPYNFWMDRNLMADLDKKFGSEFRINHYGTDIQESFLIYDFNCGLHKKFIADEKTHWQTEPTLSDIEKIYQLKWLDEKSKSVYNMIDEDRKRLPNTAIFAMSLTPLDCYFDLRTMEIGLMDFYDHPDEAKYYIETAGKKLATMIRGLKDHDVDLVYLAGDICSSKGMIMSKEMIKEYCFEPIKDCVKAAHEIGLKIFYHSDGNVTDILDLFVEYGFDGINPLQPHLNDCKKFKEKYGKKLMLYGGIDNCFAIPDNTPMGVREHIRSQFEILGKDGGLIFSSHDIPDYVKIENIDAMCEEIKMIKP